MLDELRTMGLLSLPDAPHELKRIWNLLVHLKEDNSMKFGGESISSKPIKIAHHRSAEPSKFLIVDHF